MAARSRCSCCPRSRCTSCSSCSRSSRPPTTACTSGTASRRSPTSSASRTTQVALASPEFRTARCQQRPDHRPVAGDPDPVLAGAGGDAQPAVPRPGAVPAAVLPAVRALRGGHRRSCSGCCCSPDGVRRLRACRPSGWARLVQDWLGDPTIVMFTLFVDHLVEVLRLPHDPHAGRPAGHPARARGGGLHRRRRPAPGLPARHPAAARADDPGLGVPVDHRRAPAVRHGLGDDRRRADQRLDHDGDLRCSSTGSSAARWATAARSP